MPTLPGYTVGGTIHVIVNNLIGFTTVPREEHTSRFAPPTCPAAGDSDLPRQCAKMSTPWCAWPAWRIEYRYTFGSDVVIDLIGYRRHGHSEVDDPTITQPLLYKTIKEHPPLWEIYARRRRRLRCAGTV